MRHFSQRYPGFDDDALHGAVWLDNADYDDGGTMVICAAHCPLWQVRYRQTPDELAARQADYYAAAITELANERTEKRRARIMAPYLALPWYDTGKQNAARQCARIVTREIARIEREIGQPND